jgi:RNA polymerase sigma-70 factor (ECF subfamily)
MPPVTATAAPSADFAALAQCLRGELTRHCYRMMGSAPDAEDCVQQTLLLGWREFAQLQDQAAGRPWLYAIATRVCLDALRKRKRRQALFGPSIDEFEPSSGDWVEPWPGGVPASGPESAAAIRLAFVSLLHELSPRARAVLLLHDVVGMTSTEVGLALHLTHAAARSALQRARAILAAKPRQTEVKTSDPAVVESYVRAWNAGDVSALIALFHQDIVVTMPPWQRTFLGRAEFARFMTGVWPRYNRFRAVATEANGQAAVALFAKAAESEMALHSLHVLTNTGQEIDEIILYAPPIGAKLIQNLNLGYPRT